MFVDENCNLVSSNASLILQNLSIHFGNAMQITPFVVKSQSLLSLEVNFIIFLKKGLIFFFFN